MLKKKRGPKRDPDRVIMRGTHVQDDIRQMDALEATGHTHAEAYRLGSRIYTKSQTPAGMAPEQIKEEVEKARIEAEAAALRYQTLLGLIQEAEEEEARAEQARQDLESAIPEAARRLYEAREAIRKGSQGNQFRIQAALDLLPPGTVKADDIRILFRSGTKAPSMEKILELIQSHI